MINGERHQRSVNLTLSLDVNWVRFVYQLLCDMKLWAVVIVSLMSFRLFLLCLFKSKLEASTTAPGIISALCMGLQFDAKVAGVILVIPLLTTICCGFWDVAALAHRIRQVMMLTFVVVTVVLCRISVGFFQEYNDNINQWLFGIYYDDTAAILKTLAVQYDVWREGALILVLTALISWLVIRFQGPLVPLSLVSRICFALPCRIILLLTAVVVFTIGIRGSLGRRPAQLKDASFTRDNFLNKIVLNPYMALNYALSEHLDSLKATNIRSLIPSGDLGNALQFLAGHRLYSSNIDEQFDRIAPGFTGVRPRHVFLIVMESYDTWALSPPFNRLGITDQLQQIAAKGLQLRPFIAASDDTMNSLATIITGYPYTGVRANYQRSGDIAYTSSIASIFRRMGYRSRFFYGGYLSWQRVGEFCKNQGFDEVYGGPHMTSAPIVKEWGVDDEDLFNFVINKTASAPPSFNLILSTSYHPPFSLDVYSKGFPVRSIPQDVAQYFDGSLPLSVLGHLWYADQCIGSFVRTMNLSSPDSLFLLTGDHFSRRYANQHPTLFDRLAVPLVMYGPSVLKGVQFPPLAAGSHKDITATLVDLSAPRGFIYNTPGISLFRGTCGIERNRAITSSVVYDISGNTTGAVPGSTRQISDIPLSDILKTHDYMIGISLIRTTKGANLPQQPGK